MPSKTPVLRFRLLLVTLVALLGASNASAYELYKTWNCKSGKHWNHDPTFGLSSKSFHTASLRNAVRYPLERLNRVGGQSFDALGWPTRSVVSVGNLRNDIWNGPLWGKNKDAAMWTIRASFGCHLTETDIVINADENHVFGLPADYGLDYWDSNSKAYGTRSFHSPRLLHEALHAAGLNHVSNAYAMQNYGKFPWQNGSSRNEMFEVLADDARGLRRLYGDGSSESDVAVYNTWRQSSVENGAAVQQVLCKPATGSGFSNGIFSLYCAADPETAVCPGERVYTRFAIVNRGTGGSVQLTERLYFSTDAELDEGDAVSPTVWSKTVDRDYREGHSFVVPDLPGGTYQPIIELSGDFEQETYRDDWIPLRGQITVPFSCGAGIDDKAP